MPICATSTHPVYYEVHGDGSPVLMITGMASVVEWFHYNVPALVDAGYRVIAQDLRGSNRDGVPAAPGPYSTRDMARDSIAILDEVGVDVAHIIGLSMGGMIAQHLAIGHPQRCNKVSIVANGLARTPPAVRDAALAAVGDDPIGRLHRNQGDGDDRRRAQLNDDEALATALSLAFTPAFETEQPERFKFFVELYHHHKARPETHLAQLHAALDHDTLDDLATITAPVQLLIGELDAVNGGCAPEMADRIPQCEFRVLAGMAHGLNLEHADAYNALVLDFLAD